MNSAHVLIDYKEVMALMEAHASEINVGLRNELQELLSLMVLQYFSRYSQVISFHREAKRQEDHLFQVLDSYDRFSYWENSEIAMAVTLLIVRITQTFLPSFNSYLDEDCNGILNVQMRNATVAHLEIEPTAFARFTQHRAA